MEYINNLKAILHSKRANIFYLEKCRVLMKDGRVVYLTETKMENQYFNIPVANTTVILLGMGTSITQAAVRMLSSAGVLLGFSGTGGTPLFMGSEIEWMTPQSEYRPTEYVQGWLSFWFDEDKRLSVAKHFQQARVKFLSQVWSKDRDLQDHQFFCDEDDIQRAIEIFTNEIPEAGSTEYLLSSEAQFTKRLYKAAALRTGNSRFTRERSSSDKANTFLNHGNYLAYGLAATCLWVLGIPHGFAVMHGKTRRGALVFDVADIIKDAIILPWAFICAQVDMNDQDFRQHCLVQFTKHKALDAMFALIKNIAVHKGDSGAMG